MKRVRDIINLQEQEPDGPAFFRNADGDDTGPYANNQDGEVTGGGRVQNYPVSAANIRWLRTQGGPFSFGYLRGHTLENLTLELLGTDLSASFIKDSGTQYDDLGTRQQEEQNAALDYFNNVYIPASNALSAQVDALSAQGDNGSLLQALSLLNTWFNGPSPNTEYDRLSAIVDATSAERSALLSRIGEYIMTGRINTSDPYELDHPELAGNNDQPTPTDPKIKRLKELLDKATKDPKSLTAAEKQELIDAGLDDFVKGGETASPLGDLGLLGLTFGLVKGAFALGLGALTKLGLMVSGTTVGDQAVDTFVRDADSVSDYNKQLAGKLVSSILSGESQEIKLSDAAAADQIKNIDLDKFADALTVGGPVAKPSSNSTVNPENKEKVLTGDWGAQGGSTIHYDPETDTLTITSEKMLRTGQKGDKFDGDKQTAFGDIPEPSDERVQEITLDVLTDIPIAADIINAVTTGQTFTTGSTFNDKTGKSEPGKTYDNAYDYLSDNPEAMKSFSDGLAKTSKDLSSGAVQGTASNVVAIRKALTQLGFPESEVEKTGGGYGQVYSQTSYSGSDIPPELKSILNQKSGNKSESKSYTTSFTLTESRKKILKNIKKPYEVPELPKKYKMNFAGKYSAQNTPDKTASQVSDELVASGNARGQRWRQKDKDWVGYETSERMNIVYDRVGHGDQYWNMIVSDNLKKKKDRELQEQLNIIAHEKALWKQNPNYETPFNRNKIDEQETLSADKDPLFKKVSKSLKKEIDYPDKPAKNGYPNDPPPKTINGYHPDLVNGQRASKYYNGLDPHSAESMPPTGNPEIDAKAKKAMDLKAKARKLKTLLGKKA